MITSSNISCHLNKYERAFHDVLPATCFSDETRVYATPLEITVNNQFTLLQPFHKLCEWNEQLSEFFELSKRDERKLVKLKNVVRQITASPKVSAYMQQIVDREPIDPQTRDQLEKFALLIETILEYSFHEVYTGDSSSTRPITIVYPKGYPTYHVPPLVDEI